VKILKTILFGLLALLVLLVLGGLLLPSSARIQRTVVIQAPPAAVFEVVNSFKRFNDWSPWYDLDPAAKYVYSGPEQGVGARFEWTSKKPEVGEGSQQIIESKPYQSVRTRLDFGPQGTAETEVAIVPVEQGSEVTWSFESQFGYNLMQRYFGLMYDGWIGADYEKGLGKLKTLLEADGAASQASSSMQITLEDVIAIDVVALDGSSSLEPNAMRLALDDAFTRIDGFMKVNALEASPGRLAVTRFYDESGWGFEAAVPYVATEETRSKAIAAANDGTIKVTRTYAGPAVKGTHVGSLATLPEAFRQLEDYMASNRLEPNGPWWEQYLTDRTRTPDAEMKVDVFMAAKPQG